jgi:hypothetical protein
VVLRFLLTLMVKAKPRGSRFPGSVGIGLGLFIFLIGKRWNHWNLDFFFFFFAVHEASVTVLSTRSRSS